MYRSWLARKAQSASAVLASYSPEVVQLLHEKKLAPLPGMQGGGLYIGALVMFDQPLSRTLRLLSQTQRQGEYLPELKHVETIRWDGNVVVDEHHVRILFIPLKYRLRFQVDFDAARIGWGLDPSFDNDLQLLEGYWELYEVSALQTLGRFGTRIVLGSAVPSLPLGLIRPRFAA